MAKITIHAVRHAQGPHNLNTANHQLRDPELTPLGETQCATLSTFFPTAPCFSSPPKITHLVASPLRRTLYTCLLSFPSEVQRGLVVTALPELQETSDLPCDTGSEPRALQQEFEGRVDFALLEEGWNSKTGKWSPASSAIEARAREARVWLRNLGLAAVKENPGEDVNVVVVTHGGFLHFFTEDWDGSTLFTGTGWANTEFRSYEFVSLEEGEEHASLRETNGSRERRKGDEKPLTFDEQRELKASAEKQHAQAGFLTSDTAKL